MAYIQNGDGVSGTQALKVNTNNEAQVALTSTINDAGYVKISDANNNPFYATENGAMVASLDGIILFEQVDGSALNTNVWNTSTDTMTITQSGGFITLNANSTTTANKYAILSSVKNIPLYGKLPLKVSWNVKVPVQPQSNLTIEIGIGSVATNASPTDGAFFRWNPATQFVAVINNAGTEIISTPAITPPPTNNDIVLLEIVLVEDIVQFYMDDIIVSQLNVALGQAYPTNAGRLPVFARVYNSGSIPATAPQISIGQCLVVQQAMNQNKQWADTLSALGRGAYQSPVTPFGQNANHTNSTSPSSATLANTTAGYSTLGGKWQFAALAAAVTDFALFAFLVPTGYQLYVSAVSISSVITGAAIGLSGTLLDWSVGVNSTAVSLATTDSATTNAPRRIPIGIQGFPTLTAIGVVGNDISRIFPTPLVVDSGRYFHIILQIPIGLATGSQIIRGDVMINGYFE